MELGPVAQGIVAGNVDAVMMENAENAVAIDIAPEESLVIQVQGIQE